jgi:hypothetical protein
VKLPNGYISEETQEFTLKMSRAYRERTQENIVCDSVHTYSE